MIKHHSNREQTLHRKLEGGGGGDSLIKAGMDVWRVQNLGRAKFPKKRQIPGHVFMNFGVPKLEMFRK